MKKGFTLIELLGVITILGILALILFPILLRHINNARDSIDEVTKTLIIDAAKDYYEDNINNYEKINGISYCINISDLDKYLINVKDENLNDIDKSKKIKMTYNNKFAYEIVDSCTYSLSRNGIDVPIVSSDSGLYLSTTDEGRLIYRGGTPNNYIWLDENGDGNRVDSELYRIISFEDDGTIKVMRDIPFNKVWDERSSDLSSGPRKNPDNSYCNYSLDSNGEWFGCNAWSNIEHTLYNGSSLKELGRNFYYQYYDSSMGTNLISNLENEGTVKDESTLNIYLNGEWFNNLEIKDYVINHSFNISGPGYWNDGPTDKGLKMEKFEESLFTWNGKIGLINLTEYLEASTNIGCTSVYSNYYYAKNSANQYIRNDSNFVWPCSTNENWMKRTDYDLWTLSPNVNRISSVWIVYSPGWFRSELVYNSLGVRPTFYLKSNIVLEGDGSSSDPYKIKG